MTIIQSSIKTLVATIGLKLFENYKRKEPCILKNIKFLDVFDLVLLFPNMQLLEDHVNTYIDSLVKFDNEFLEENKKLPLKFTINLGIFLLRTLIGDRRFRFIENVQKSALLTGYDLIIDKLILYINGEEIDAVSETNKSENPDYYQPTNPNIPIEEEEKKDELNVVDKLGITLNLKKFISKPTYG